MDVGETERCKRRESRAFGGSVDVEGREGEAEHVIYVAWGECNVMQAVEVLVCMSR